ncbi:DUF397 domain-containing protein [Streptomyces sp. uw30]|uniref:DUF397 domain-containing protein n=1 Tax=Streptomyces sp. uw30 TaxID=1828179 RepID=UPI0011CE54B2|nr:DUF397 domain-containing protein [Streptomyces sp. uw30]TXS41563.1 DUF397 domain-containing protein [Streptomyces sp. uw30]
MGNTPELVNAPWRKSSYSGNTGGDCVEVADATPHIAVRDSKNPGVGTLTLTPEAYATFVAFVAEG